MTPPSDAADVYLGVINRLEPDLTNIDVAAALASIAISLKRIADELERSSLNGDLLATAIEGAIYRAIVHSK